MKEPKKGDVNMSMKCQNLKCGFCNTKLFGRLCETRNGNDEGVTSQHFRRSNDELVKREYCGFYDMQQFRAMLQSL